jgi:hypothetical protein
MYFAPARYFFSIRAQNMRLKFQGAARLAAVVLDKVGKTTGAVW